MGRDGLFVAEGRVVLEKALRAIPDRLVSVLVAENRLTSLTELLGGLPGDIPIYVAGQAVMDAVVGFPIHRGILALGRRPDRSADALLAHLPDAAMVVGLVGVANHDNMGGVFRNAAAFGADAVLIDATSCDPLYRKAIRVSVGAALTVPFARCAAGEDMVSLLLASEFDVAALSPAGAADIGELRPARRQAVLFGAEGPGLPGHILARTRTLRIAMRRGFDSLNLATSTGIVLHQIAVGREQANLT